MRAIYQQVWAPVPEDAARAPRRPDERVKAGRHVPGPDVQALREALKTGVLALPEQRARAAAGAVGPRRAQVAAPAMTRTPLADLASLADESRERFEDLATRFRAARARPGPARAAPRSYWQVAARAVHARRDATQGLASCCSTRRSETFRFLTREVDMTDLGALPWYGATRARCGASSWRWRSG